MLLSSLELNPGSLQDYLMSALHNVSHQVFGENPIRSRGTAIFPVQERAKDRALPSAHKKPKVLSQIPDDNTYPSKLCVYHAGTGRITFLASVKLSTLFIFAFFGFVVTPAYYNNEGLSPNVVRTALCAVVPLAFVAHTTSPFVTFIHMRLPPFARQSEDMLRRYVRTLPPQTELNITTMSIIAKPRVSTVKLSDLAPVSRRFSIVNLARDTASENAIRKCNVDNADVSDAHVWGEMVGDVGQNLARGLRKRDIDNTIVSRNGGAKHGGVYDIQQKQLNRFIEVEARIDKTSKEGEKSIQVLNKGVESVNKRLNDEPFSLALFETLMSTFRLRFDSRPRLHRRHSSGAGLDRILRIIKRIIYLGNQVCAHSLKPLGVR
ncbi:hypothetical protein FHL15_010341 [Xylaria flabelliformis]|uniref:Uncharacterized protein n=1 Tax=Xylaria flabelliformis TaxID=2512241 RepID=A0A553HLD4_9PEZI|nr:hypothetical protein FHL15_010341 [Xylaria flabelliformis]